MSGGLYERLGVKTYINAADSYTMIGGSRMPPEVVAAMAEASRHFVPLEELHLRVGARIAELTRNEAAVVTSGAAAGLTVATAACMTGTDEKLVRKLPTLEGIEKCEVVIHRCQRNGFDMAIAQTGARLVEIGDVESTFAWQLEDAIGPRTACVVYFTSSQYDRGALPLADVIRIADARGVPVVVDAAAQLPPVDNLWRYTRMGASLVIFSGGKTLFGPQSSGFVAGREALVAACRLHVGARISIGRPMKVGKEELAGLLAAVERYVALDHEAVRAGHEALVGRLCAGLREAGYAASRQYPGPTGQDYPLVRVDLGEAPFSAERLAAALREGEPGVLVALTWDRRDVLLNPLHLREDEAEVVITRMRAVMADALAEAAELPGTTGAARSPDSNS
ncbi:aminotransferase class V-fold PLP-dependent enzyme [Paenibacillus cymbidii]|uniref:aminotransferase class V-fold PLP-dependent enzyme n=1 Tax=Paenibacillus cymbidii TaxID=1639034 RepID=UPI00108193A8|nr:aminotransferase class V-fold PLP-dependent enzyme [Paenibacillus cymbidii]